MMVKSRSTFALMALLFVGSALAAPDSLALDSLAPDAPTQEAARRHAATKDALALVSKAREAYQAKRYTDAVDHYRNALSVLPKAPATQKLHTFICESLSDALIARAIDYRSVGRREEAVAFLQEAVKLSPDSTRAKTELIYTQDPVRTNPALTPTHVGDVEEVSRLLSLGYGYLELGKYDEAIKTFEDVTRYDEYNVAARRGMEKAQQLRARYFNAAYDTRRSEMLAEVGKTWEDAMNHSSEPVVIAGAEGSGTAEEDGSVAGSEEAAFAAAVKQMQVPSFALEDNTLDEAIEVLRNNVKRLEATGGLGAGRRMDVRSNFGAQGSPERQAVMSRRASIQLDGVTLKELLDEVCRLYDVDYYYVPYGIEFSYSGKDYGRLMERVFNVPAHFFDKDSSGDEDEEDDAFATRGRVSVKRENPVKVLTNMGVSFPEGANAIYRASERRLRVRNTVQNLDKIEQLLNAPPPNQWVVVFNVMTIETTDQELEDLGFDWLFNMHLGGDLYGGGGMSQAASGIVGMPSINTAVGGTNQPQGGAATSGLRSIRQISGAQGLTRLIEQGSVENFASSLSMASTSPNIFGIRGVWNAADVTVMMRGLSQNRGTDTLQNERLIFTPGSDEQVSIVNVREMFYPEAYDPPQIPNNRSNNNYNNNWDDDDDDDDTITNGGSGPSTSVIAGSHPTDFVRFGYSEDGAGGIGGIIQIHKAEPAPDGQSVNLAITTTVNEFEGFVDWGTPIYAGMSTTGGGMLANNRINRVMLSENHIFQPVFKRRMVNTTLSVANGGVIVIGGMLEARVVRYEDKVPVLGDLPLVGRLFRSEGEDKERRALLIFAKVDIVDPTGRSVNGSEIETSADTPM